MEGEKASFETVYTNKPIKQNQPKPTSCIDIRFELSFFVNTIHKLDRIKFVEVKFYEI